MQLAPGAAPSRAARFKERALSTRAAFAFLRNWIQIGAGLAVQSEIKTGSRRIIHYLLSPLARAFGQAGRER